MSEIESVVDKSTLYRKMSAVMGRLKRLPKNGYNAFHKYNYVLDADVMEAVREAMSAEGLCFFVDMGEIKVDGNKTTIRFRVEFACSETGATHMVDWIGEALDKQDKGINKAATAAIKYCLLKTFLISTGDTDDTDAESETRTTTKAKSDNGNGQESKGEHWIKDNKRRAAFWAWAGGRGLDEIAVHKALNVETVFDFTGTAGDAKTLIVAWLEVGRELAAEDEAKSKEMPE